MAGVDPAIHEAIVQPFFVDDRAKPGHDGADMPLRRS